MKNTKYRFNTLCIYDYRGVEDHLSAMAAKGWRLEKAGSQFWKYRRAEPAQARYAVTYSADASQFNPGPTEGQQSLEELCGAAGWEKVSDWFQMQIFCTEDPNAVPLETDEGLRLENIHRAMRKNFLPSSVVLLAIGLLMSWSFLGTLCVRPLRIFQRNGSLFSGLLFVLLTLLEIYTLCHYYGWRRKSRQSIEDGEPCAPIDTGAYQRLNRWGMVLVGVLSVLYLLMEFFSNSGEYVSFFLLHIALFLVITFLIRKTTAVLRNQGVSKGWNMAGTLIAYVVLCTILTGGIVWGGIHFGWFSGRSGETYTYQHMEFDVHPREDAPLTLSGLTGEDYKHVSRTLRNEGSFFLPEWSYREYVFNNTEEEDPDVWPGSVHLSYTIYKPRARWLYDATLKDLTATEKNGPYQVFEWSWREDDAAPWGAEAAYRRYLQEDTLNTWILAWPGKIVSVSLDWPPADGEKALIAERLGPEA